MAKSINPATGKEIKKYNDMTESEVEKILQKADSAYEKWQSVNYSERAKLMFNAAKILKNKSKEFAELMTLEMGKPILQSIAEVNKCAWVCEYYAENSEKFLKDEEIKTDASKSFVTYQSLGVILAIMPWNFPFWQVYRFAAPNLMAGNAGILKHASNVSGCALAIESVFKEAGFPEDLFRTIIYPSQKMEGVIKHNAIKAVTITGSVPAGKSVAKAAGSVLKKTVLELGGSDPYVILEDADLNEAASTCVNARLINGGQSCIAAKRFIIVEKVYDKFEELFLSVMKNKKMGDPMNEINDVRPSSKY